MTEEENIYAAAQREAKRSLADNKRFKGDRSSAYMTPGTWRLRFYASKNSKGKTVLWRRVKIHDLTPFNSKQKPKEGEKKKRRFGLYLCEGENCRICAAIKPLEKWGNFWKIKARDAVIVAAVVYNQTDSKYIKRKRPFYAVFRGKQMEAVDTFTTSLKEADLQKVFTAKEHFLLQFHDAGGTQGRRDLIYHPSLKMIGRRSLPADFTPIDKTYVTENDKISDKGLVRLKKVVQRRVEGVTGFHDPSEKKSGSVNKKTKKPANDGDED